MKDCCFLGAAAGAGAGTATGGATAVAGAPGGSGGGAVVASISRWACSACSSDVLNPKLIMPPELPKLPPVCEGRAAASPGGGHAQIWSVPPRGNHGFRSLSSRYFQWFSVLNSSLKSKTPHHKLYEGSKLALFMCAACSGYPPRNGAKQIPSLNSMMGSVFAYR